MDNVTDRFPVSGCPTFLEWYRCYEDPSRREAMDGMELRDKGAEWDECAKAKWHFFYRPLRAWVGKPQKKQIWEREVSIAAARTRLDFETKKIIKASIISGIGIAFAFWLWEYLVAIPLIYISFSSFQFYRLKIRLEERIEQWQREIEALNQEIQALLKQIPQAPNETTVEGWLREEMQAQERKCLAEVVNVSTDDQALFSRIRHQPIENVNHNRYRLHGLLIEGWGPLQPEKLRGPFGEEPTGARKVIDDIGLSITTFRVGSEKQAISRVSYLQFIFLLAKNINVYGFFYDFVTQKSYGRRSETFQYNHVTNYSIREVETGEGSLVNQIVLPDSLMQSLLGKEISAFFLAVSSGAYFRCVLMDENVISSINEWQKVDQEIRRKALEFADRSSLKREYDDAWKKVSSEFKETKKRDHQELKGRAERNAKEEEWVNREREEFDQAMRELTDRRSFLEEKGVHVARRVLQQIRDEIENYVQTVVGVASAS